MADPSCNANYGGETVSLDSTVMLQNRALVTVATIAADDSDAKSGAQSLDQIFHPPWFDGQNSPSTEVEAPVPVAEVDFSIDSPFNTPYSLKDGAQILTGPDGSKALRIDKDGPYALIPGVNIGPSAMPACTLMIGLYVESFANNRGWVFGHEENGYDRTILVHDDRFGGGLASAVGKTWNPWTDGSKGKVPTKQWVHLTAVFRQNGDSYVYLNGIRSDNKVTAKNNEGRNDLYVGRPEWKGHWVDSWIKEVRVFDEALTDASVVDYTEKFLSQFPTTTTTTAVQAIRPISGPPISGSDFPTPPPTPPKTPPPTLPPTEQQTPSPPSLTTPPPSQKTWTRIIHCAGEASVNRMDFSALVIEAMAAAATQIKICTQGNQTDCVTSEPGSFPIQMLREGWTFSHNKGASCNASCIKDTWKGPRVNHLASYCGDQDTQKSGALNKSLDHTAYFACGSPGGLHLQVKDGGWCGWTWNSGHPNDSLEVFIDAQGVSTTPALTTPAPTTTTTTTTTKGNGMRRARVQLSM